MLSNCFEVSKIDELSIRIERSTIICCNFFLSFGSFDVMVMFPDYMTGAS